MDKKSIAIITAIVSLGFITAKLMMGMLRNNKRDNDYDEIVKIKITTRPKGSVTVL